MDDVVAPDRLHDGRDAAADVVQVLARNGGRRDGAQTGPQLGPRIRAAEHVDLVPEGTKPGTEFIEHPLDPAISGPDAAGADDRNPHPSSPPEGRVAPRRVAVAIAGRLSPASRMTRSIPEDHTVRRYAR
jgi:hypothetical protein